METDPSVWQEILAILLPPAVVLLTTAITYGMTKLTKWLKDQEGMTSLAATAEVVAAVVNDMNAETVAKLKEKASDGKLTKEEILDVQYEAINKVKNQLPQQVASASTRMVNDLDAYIKGKIEQEVAVAKSAKALEPLPLTPVLRGDPIAE